MLVFGTTVMLAAAGLGGWIGWANREATVHLELAGYVWTGRLYGVLLAGGVLTGWFVLGAACIQLRVRERWERRAARSLDFPADPAQRSAAAGKSAPPAAAPLQPARWAR